MTIINKRKKNIKIVDFDLEQKWKVLGQNSNIDIAKRTS